MRVFGGLSRAGLAMKDSRRRDGVDLRVGSAGMSTVCVKVRDSILPFGEVDREISARRALGEAGYGLEEEHGGENGSGEER